MKKLLKEQKKDWNAISDKVWQDGVIVFDTNVLLNLYRYNKDARNELLKLMKSYQSRLWMPYQVGYEFLANCEGIKKWLLKGYKDLSNQVEKCKDDFFKYYDNNYAKHKHINKEELNNLFDQQLQPIKDKLSEWEKAEPDYDKEDVVKTKVLALYDQRVGQDFNIDQLLEIYAQGKIRYDNKIPPGYRDIDKWKMGARYVYGDLIMWMQIIDYAKSNDKDIIFVVDDLKEDWWEKEDGKIDKPRRELLYEFKYRTGRDVLIRTQKGFVEASKKKLKEATIKEIERVREENQYSVIKASESLAAMVPKLELPTLSAMNLPTYDEIHKLAMNQNIETIQSLRDSWKKELDQLGYRSISEVIAKLNGSSLLAKKK